MGWWTRLRGARPWVVVAVEVVVFVGACFLWLAVMRLTSDEPTVDILNMAALWLLGYAVVSPVIGFAIDQLVWYLIASIIGFVLVSIGTMVSGAVWSPISMNEWGEDSMILLAPVMYFPIAWVAVLVIRGILRLVFGARTDLTDAPGDTAELGAGAVD